METVDISLGHMAILYLFLLIPIFIMWRLGVSVICRLLVSAGRMSAQLVLIGLYLKYLFEWNNAALNFCWLTVMIFVAAAHILRSAHLRRKELFLPAVLAIALSVMIVLTPFIGLIIRPHPILDARYMIPIAGMLLGNTLSANIVALNHFTSALRGSKKELQTAFSFGATRMEAVMPFLGESFKRAVIPTITTLGTMGLVSLPGMMTGQLLAGSFPVVAIKYQIAIMVAIVTAGSLSLFLTLLMTVRYLFDERDNIRQELFLDV